MEIIRDMIVPDSLLMWKEFELVCGIDLKSDQHLISLYNMTPESHTKVMRIKGNCEEQLPSTDSQPTVC